MQSRLLSYKLFPKPIMAFSKIR